MCFFFLCSTTYVCVCVGMCVSVCLYLRRILSSHFSIRSLGGLFFLSYVVWILQWFNFQSIEHLEEPILCVIVCSFWLCALYLRRQTATHSKDNLVLFCFCCCCWFIFLCTIATAVVLLLNSTMFFSSLHFYSTFIFFCSCLCFFYSSYTLSTQLFRLSFSTWFSHIITFGLWAHLIQLFIFRSKWNTLVSFSGCFHIQIERKRIFK